MKTVVLNELAARCYKWTATSFKTEPTRDRYKCSPHEKGHLYYLWWKSIKWNRRPGTALEAGRAFIETVIFPTIARAELHDRLTNGCKESLWITSAENGLW